MRFLAYALLAVLAGCSGGAPPGDGGADPGVVTVRGHLPFVEGIDFPDKIVANAGFEIHVLVSAALDPESLSVNARGHRDSSVTGLVIPRVDFEDGFQLETWLYSEPVAPSPREAIVFEMPALPVGEYSIRISSAESQALGGLERDVMIAPFKGPLDFTSVEYQDYTFNVVPE
jgi:hypothetical protein